MESNKLKEINGKYYQECEVVMLATNTKSTFKGQVVIGAGNHLFNALETNDIGSLVAQHLYITSNEEIKEGDWCYNSKRKSIELGKYMIGTNEFIFCKKIIATTDTSLTIIDYVDCEYPLPQPSKQFIQKYIEEYNKGRVISEVEVEYEDKFLGYFPNITATGTGSEPKYKIQPKLNPDNTINIKPIKDSWSREEMFDCWLYSKGIVLREETDQIKRERIQFNKWIEEHL